ncbi:hypothetical protein LOTGIDRAFT_116422 [Lottia gigantea]|uniref:Nucleotide-diphospho-sugar transferase domain-containing protein n=1 Tax=Lottia gigantea TaxID=225164 RepID=V4ALW6_LOTGI|nr:hypothetical protein LOTGIDRAFT_116422 [Lottia gigantea]ESO95755.1 hypothetical protein LOTGIDRAFT_116422 [Lottia gigantea]
MKTKNFYILVLLISVTSVALWLVSYPSPTFRNIMSTTQNNIRKIPKHMQMSKSPDLEVDKKYLDLLGFDSESKPKNDIVVIGSALMPADTENTILFLKSAQEYVPNLKLVLFDMGLSKADKQTLTNCRNETKHCEIRKFNFDQYPSHISDFANKSYKPICIQLLLKEFGTVIWADTSELFASSDIDNTMKQAKTEGLVAWTIEDATSSLTHPKMFDYFKTDQKKYFFHHAVQTSHIILVNTDKIHENVMLPWVKCALVEECINPMGAQNSGCNYQRKPKFRYTGCHWYDMSALNVILGLAFDFDEAYSGKDKIFWTKFDQEKAKAENMTDGAVHKVSVPHRVYF